MKSEINNYRFTVYDLERRTSSGLLFFMYFTHLPWAAALWGSSCSRIPHLGLNLPPTGNGAGAKGGTTESPHTTPWSWALLAGSHSPSQYDCMACRQLHLLLGQDFETLLLQWYLSLCSSWHGKYREVMSANTPVFEVLNTPNQDPACFDKVNYPFWNVLGLLPCSFSWALFVPAGCCFNTDTSSGAFKLHTYCTCRTHCSQPGSPENMDFRSITERSFLSFSV